MRFFDTKIAKRLDDSSEVSLHHGTGAYLLGLLFRLSLVVRPSGIGRSTTCGQAGDISYLRRFYDPLRPSARYATSRTVRSHMGSRFLLGLERLCDRQAIRVGRQVGHGERR